MITLDQEVLYQPWSAICHHRKGYSSEGGRNRRIYQRQIVAWLNMSQSSSQLSQLGPPGRGKTARKRVQRPLFWILLFGFLVFGVVQIPREVGRWHLAKAVQLRGNGEAELAYRELELAMGWFADSPELLLQRGEWELEDGKREEALADCEAMLAAGKESDVWLSIHASFLQQAGNFEDAVEDWKKIEAFSERSGIPNRATALNGIAYAQALARTDLEKALSCVNEALELARGNPSILDTRGYIHYLREDYEDALEDLDLAVAGMDKRVELADENAKANAMPPLFRRVANSRPKRLREIEEPIDAAAARELLGTAAAVVHYHRCLVLTELGRNDESKKEKEIARLLAGREPDETLF
jgi:tetratricopeptide (TPR) repeat protein